MPLLASDLLPCRLIDRRLPGYDLIYSGGDESRLIRRLALFRFVPRIGPGLPVDQNNPDPGLDMERASDTFIKVPLILGVSTTESNLDFNENDIQYGFEEDHRNRILRTFIRNAYVYHLNEIFSAVRNEYTDWDKPILHPIIIRDSTMEALSDGHTVAPLMRIAFYHARRGAKTYFYHFSHQTKDSGMLQVCDERLKQQRCE